MNTKYIYTECGLDYIYILGLDPIEDDHGEKTFKIPHIGELHQQIARGIILTNYGLSGKALRFLRTEMGYTQAEFARFVSKDTQTIGRWEREEIIIDQNAEYIIRNLAIEKLQLDVKLTVEELVELCVPTARTQPIPIAYNKNNQGSHYSLKAA